MASQLPAASQEVKRKAAREVIDILHEIATLLNTHLDRQQLSYCVSLIENGANPEALANVIRKLREDFAQGSSEEGEEEEAVAR
ncbi:mitotic-spindle organizing gamma-tubulin ring associated-domain-containing protein [Massariosphaeria phaeospora]|uniref:Mitotic-spindle organizing protein 1 n=1 Tax=Massariosphaeria phaeospora TaxID=100035 RepID=A0A7C8I8M1_9PLEO|nr:mitotic-spindle organizing gamma-tubulin ring associated-domain-containing protein [Massariosphaeria phaeospora]